MPVTQDQVKDMLARLPFGGRFVGRKEVKELPAILWGDEQIIDLVQGLYDKGNGILVATDKRLIFVDKGLIYGLKVEDFPLGKVSSIQYATGMLYGTLTIFASGNKAVITNVEKNRVREFAEGVRQRLQGASTSQPPPEAPHAAASPSDLTAEVQRLAEMHAQGLLTEEEFTAAKKKLLGL